MKIPFTKSAIQQFHAFQKSTDDLANSLAGLEALVNEVNAQAEAEERKYRESGTIENARNWMSAKMRLDIRAANSSSNIPITLLAGERSAVERNQINARRSPEFITLVGRALREHNENLQHDHDSKRASFLKSLGVENAETAVDSIPILKSLVERISRNRNAVGLLVHPDPHARGIAIDNAVAFINEPAEYVAPTHPAPLPQQGFPPGYRIPGEPLPESVVQVTPKPVYMDIANLKPDVHMAKVEAIRAQQAREQAEINAKQREALATA
jgi:hypothetical protein